MYYKNSFPSGHSAELQPMLIWWEQLQPFENIH